MEHTHRKQGEDLKDEWILCSSEQLRSTLSHIWKSPFLLFFSLSVSLRKIYTRLHRDKEEICFIKLSCLRSYSHYVFSFCLYFSSRQLSQDYDTRESVKQWQDAGQLDYNDDKKVSSRDLPSYQNEMKQNLKYIC